PDRVVREKRLNALPTRDFFEKRGLLSPSEIVGVSSLAMNVKEAEVLGIVEGQNLGRRVVSYCFVKFRHGDIEEFASHMRYETLELMMIDVSEVDRLLRNDDEVRRLVDVVMAELADLFSLTFKTGIDDEDASQLCQEPAGQNVIKFPASFDRISSMITASRVFSSLITEID
ncbi:hypothetical protein, partial [Roseobacter sp.]|uniref:hypothetical protein n=1 Tax=Roseobacter sp. TaxID=1907202 RepID=UPI00385C9B35